MSRGRGHHHPSYCRVCKRGREEVGRISQTGKCFDCGKAVMNDVHEQLRNQRGPAFDAWCFGLIEYSQRQLQRLLAAEG